MLLVDIHEVSDILDVKISSTNLALGDFAENECIGEPLYADADRSMVEVGTTSNRILAH
jgi:hypothetical protein